MFSLPGFVTVSEAAQQYSVTRQRMHALIKTYGVSVSEVGGVFLIPKQELQKIPKKRPSGVHLEDRK